MHPTTPGKSTAYRPDVDGLRTVAVLAVLFFHVGFPAFGGGFVGVDVFFVISGFLITRLLVAEIEEGRFTFGGFYVRRARRLFPALFATLVLTFAVGTWVLSAQQFEMLGRTTIFALLSVSNIQFWQEIDYFNPDAEFNPLLHTWSLAVEEQFYFLWPLALFLLMRRGAATRRLVGVLVLTTLAGLFLSQLAVGVSETAAFYLLPFRIFELAIGALMVWVVKYKPTRNWALEATALFGLALIAYSVFAFEKTTPFPGFNALWPCLGAALLIYAGEARWTGLLLRNRVSVGIGLVSYSLYLVHWPIIVLYSLWKFDPLSTQDRWLIVGASLLLAVLFQQLIEKPFRAHPRPAPGPGSGAPRRYPNRAFVGGAVALALVLIVPAAVVWGAKGWPTRFEHGGGIERLLTGSKIKEPPAVRLDAPKLRVAVMADSHVVAWNGLREWGDERGIEFVRFQSTGGCPPLYGIVVHGREKQSALCLERKDRELEKAAAGDFDVVLLVGRWGLYTGEITPTDRIKPRRLTIGQVPGDDVSLARSREAFREGLRRTLKLMDGKRVVFLGQVPPLGKDPYGCVARQKDWRAVEKLCIAAKYDEMLGETRWATKEAQAQSAKDSRLVVFDPYPVFCAKKTCRATDGVDMLYRDDNHLSNAGSRKLAAVLGPFVVENARAARPATGASAP